jgi:hypothetical protein
MEEDVALQIKILDPGGSVPDPDLLGSITFGLPGSRARSVTICHRPRSSLHIFSTIMYATRYQLSKGKICIANMVPVVSIETKVIVFVFFPKKLFALVFIFVFDIFGKKQHFYCYKNIFLTLFVKSVKKSM